MVWELHPGNEEPGGGLAAHGSISPAMPCSCTSRISCCSWFQHLAPFLLSSHWFKQKDAWKGRGGALDGSALHPLPRALWNVEYGAGRNLKKTLS